MELVNKITRKTFECPIFGHPRDLLSTRLPTHEDVLKCCFQERFNLAIETNNKSVSFTKVSAIVASKVKAVFEIASIPTVSEYRIVQLVNKYHESYYSLRKSLNRDKDKQLFKSRLQLFKDKSATIFDVSACKCEILVECNCHKSPELCECSLSVQCNCEKSKRIPSLELKFVYLQRKYGLGKIGSVDVSESNKLVQRNIRRQAELQQTQRTLSQDLSQPSCSSSVVNNKNTDSPDKSRSDDEDVDYEPANKSPWQMRVKLKCTAMTSDRYGVSDRAAAAIASSVLKDIGLISGSDYTHVVDKNKLRREKDRNRSEVKMEALNEDFNLQGLYFDGRKDQTLVVEKINSKHYRSTKKEEHYSLIQEPGSIYIGHVTPSSGSAINIANSIIFHLSTLKMSVSNIDVVGCDGTVTNTGWKTGVIRLIEEHLRRPVQWAVCLLHFNELPFRHLFQTLDGDTTGPKSFGGPLGVQLNGCEKLPPVQFESIECKLPEIDRKVLSKDQQYLLDISTAIKSGVCSEDLCLRDPGPQSHSRWLTTANRVLRLYVSTAEPSCEHKILVSFILKSYMPVWFAIKKGKYFTDGPKHVFEAIKTSRFLPEELLKVVDPVLQRNSFFAHPENLLLSMLVDERKFVKELALRRVLKARTQTHSKKTVEVRHFILPTLNLSANDYTEMIDWGTSQLSSPPLLRKLTDEDIRLMIESENTTELKFEKFPCHTQAVERSVKLVTEASQKVVGADSRDGFIRTTLKSRAIMPDFNHKAQFK